MRHLFSAQRRRSRGVYSHGENTAQRTRNKRNSSFTIVCHEQHSRHKLLVCESVIYGRVEIRNRILGGNGDQNPWGSWDGLARTANRWRLPR